MATERKEKLIRILQLIQTTDVKSPMNASEIIHKLEREFSIVDVDRRAIYRDINMLQYCGYEIQQCSDKRKGWYMEKHAFDDWEIKIMMDAVAQAKFVSSKEATMIKEKLVALTSQRGRSRFSHMMHSELQYKESNDTMGHAIEMMLEAMYTGKKIEFQYTEITNDMERVLRKDGKKYVFNLYTIYWSNNNYYLIGSHDHHEGLTNYRLDRIVNLTMSEQPIVKAEEKIGANPEQFIQKYIEESVNHFSGEVVHIQVEYTPSPTTNAILYDFVGKDIKVKKISDSTYQATFTKMQSVTLTAWFLQYVNRFTVRKPQSLVEDIQRELQEACKRY